MSSSSYKNSCICIHMCIRPWGTRPPEAARTAKRGRRRPPYTPTFVHNTRGALYTQGIYYAGIPAWQTIYIHTLQDGTRPRAAARAAKRGRCRSPESRLSTWPSCTYFFSYTYADPYHAPWLALHPPWLALGLRQPLAQPREDVVDLPLRGRVAEVLVLGQRVVGDARGAEGCRRVARPLDGHLQESEV